MAKAATATFLDDSVVAENTQLAVPEAETVHDISTAAYNFETPELDQSDLSVPRMRIAQQMSEEVAKHRTAEMGQILVRGYEPVTEVQFLILGFTKRREYRDADDNSEVLCQSPNGRQGYGTPGIACAGCKNKDWGWNEIKGKGIPPICTLIYSYFIYSLTHDLVTVFEFKRASENDGKQLNSLLVSRGGYGKFVVKMSTSIVSGKNTYARPTLMLDNSFTPDQVADLYQQAKDRFGFGA